MTDKPSIESLRACLERVCTGIMDTWDKGQLRAALSELESLRAVAPIKFPSSMEHAQHAAQDALDEINEVLRPIY